MGTKLRRAGLLFVVLAALAVPVQALAGEQVPFKGSDSGISVVGTNPCASGFIPLDINASGEATLVGRYTYHADECVGLSAFYGAFTITAANGDTISGPYTGEVVAVVGNLLSYEQDNVITDGTGRFAGASGELHVSGILNVVNLKFSEEISGTVSSPGAAKK